ncbi:MAG: Nudix family hydrolase [Gammaproteobacteria bacterium]|nr:Nudix family hydrolase [Gammaproteobacteria bacterium]
MQNTLKVAVAIIQAKDGRILFAERPAGKACAGEWEFPGGKIEPGETARQALFREIEEELAIHITQARPWITVTHVYPHATVLLHFFIVTAWTGDEHGMEGQKLSWQDVSNLTIAPLLAANAPVIRALLLPHIYAISCASEMGVEMFLQRLPQAINNGLRLLQLREKHLNNCQLKRLVDQILPITIPAGITVLANSSMPEEQLNRFSGIHLTSTHLMRLEQRPDFKYAGASCHNKQELQHAASLGLDFAVLSPVKATPSHPDAIPLGTETMAELIAECPIPVYALGGMSLEDLDEIQSHGAQGIAMMRNAWLY